MRLPPNESRVILLIVGTLLAFNMFYPPSMKDEVWFWNVFIVIPSAILIAMRKKAGLSQAYRDEWAMAAFSSGFVFLINAFTHPGERAAFLMRFILGFLAMAPFIHLLRAVREYFLPDSWKASSKQ